MTLAALLAPRRATSADLDWVKRLADRHKREIGFVVRGALAAAIEREELLVCEGVAFCHYRTRRDGVAVIYEIVSEQPGCGRALLEATPRPTRLKCPVDLPANEFYARMGGTLVTTETGKVRALNVWEWR